jgi:hypothetical protein
MNKNIFPNCGHAISPPVWNCMKGHMICAKCCKSTSPCPTCALSTTAAKDITSTTMCIYCSYEFNDIVPHITTIHNYNGPYFIHNSFSLEILSDSQVLSISNLYKRIADQEEKLYAFDLIIKDGILSAGLKPFSKTLENLKFSISNGPKDHSIMYLAKNFQEEFLVSLKPIRQHFTYINSAGQEVYKINVDIGEDCCYI